MTDLSDRGQEILRLLVRYIERKKFSAGSPESYLGYREVRTELGIPYDGRTDGEILKEYGLNDLALWIKDEGHPAVTGLIVDKYKGRPGPGYFDVYGLDSNAMEWWDEQVSWALEFPWGPYLGFGSPSPPDTPEAADNDDLPRHVEAKIKRIVRDTVVARTVKKWHNFECQLCDTLIEFPWGQRYAEAHHIKPLGKHDGRDKTHNVLCLCPNHHAMCDLGLIKLDLTKLKKAKFHTIDSANIEYHNNSIYRES
jgi:hypothetical protein